MYLDTGGILRMGRPPRVRLDAAGLGGGGYGHAGNVLSLSPVAYWRMLETSGTAAADLSGNGYTGTYNGATLGNTPGPFAGLAPLFGTTGVVNMNGSVVGGAISGVAGALVIALKVAEAAWTDGAVRAVCTIFAGGDYIRLTKEATNNRLRWRRTASAVNQIRDKDGLTTTGWMILGLDWSEAANQVIAYYQGVQEGIAIAASAWAGGDPTVIVAGAADAVGANELNNWAAEFALFAAPLGAAGHELLAGQYFAG